MKKCDPHTTNLVLTEAPNTPVALQKNCDEIVFEEYEFASYSRTTSLQTFSNPCPTSYLRRGRSISKCLQRHSISVWCSPSSFSHTRSPCRMPTCNRLWILTLHCNTPLQRQANPTSDPSSQYRRQILNKLSKRACIHPSLQHVR